MKRITFIKKLVISLILSVHRPGLRVISLESGEVPLKLLGADQAGDQIILFDAIPDNDGLVQGDPVWNFAPDFRPTDAKRVDQNDRISVLVASHGAIYEVPFDHKSKVVWAPTYTSCHSVEKLPDGNLISASSNDHQLTIHFNPQPDGERIKLTSTSDLRFETAHGVVYDRSRNCLWAIGQVLGKFTYIPGETPRIELAETWELPYNHTDGHDLFPLPNGNLLITTHEGVLELPMGNFSDAIIHSNLKNVKSAGADEHGHLYITDPTDIKSYETWQTDSILNLANGMVLKRPGARFYKVRPWLPNSFSYF
ncbi:MAG: hypothetical protein KDC80_04760 [Saprospiraceae bacterium]|nr:hypothetical protein [Saprospiraceae bacterium]